MNFAQKRINDKFENEFLFILRGKDSIENLNTLRKNIGNISNKYNFLKDSFITDLFSTLKFGIYYSQNLLEISEEYLIINNITFDYLFLGPEFLVSVSQPALGMVYKIMEINKSPCIKFSEEKEKQTIPGSKITNRLFDERGEIICDLLSLDNEEKILYQKRIDA